MELKSNTVKYQFEPKILAFCCNWCSYAGADLAGVSRLQYPDNIRIIRVMCSGRIEIPFILRGLLAGADGILVTGCHIGDCHYIGGNENAEKRIIVVKELLKRLGINENRIRLEWISSAEGQRFADIVKNFVDEIKNMGANELTFHTSVLKTNDSKEGEKEKTLKEIVSETQAYHCLSCGKCSGICPITRSNKKFLPRTIVENAIVKGKETNKGNDDIWSCLTCAKCEQICLGNVKYSEFIKQARIIEYKEGTTGECAHLGMLHDLMRILANEKIKQNRVGWLTEDLKISNKGDTLFFTGCTPYFDILFRDIEPNMLEIPRSTIKLLNRLGIEPVIFENEKCCGHDLIWSGDLQYFKKLAKQNIDMIKKSGVKRIIFSCPECLRTLKLDYPEYYGKDVFKGIELLHISEFILQSEKSNKNIFNIQVTKQKVTYHDSCRLGNHLGIVNAPRDVIKSIGELVEMERSKERAVCCGTSTWLKCDANSKISQIKRLQEAKDVANKMLTTCPKCLIHFKCAMSDKEDTKINTCVEDFSVFIDKALSGNG